MIREAAISSWARVILAVDWTLLIRRRTARSWAPILPVTALLVLRLAVGRRDVLRDRLLLDLALVERRSRLLRDQQLAVGLLERAAELADRVLERHDGVFAQVAGLPDRVIDAGPRRMRVTQEVGLEPPHVLDRHVVEIALVSYPDGDHLTFDRERAVLRLLEQLDQPGTAIQLGTGCRVQIGGERGECLQVAVLRQG